MSAARELVYWLIGAALFALALWLLAPVLTPFALGIAIAYALQPASRGLQSAGLSRAAAAALLTIGIVCAVVVLLVVLAPILQTQILEFAGRLPRYMELLRERAIALVLLAQAELTPEQTEEMRAAFSRLAGSAVGLLGALVTGLWSGGVAIANLLSLLIITPIVSFYMLRDFDRMVAAIDGWLPRRYVATINEQARAIDRMLAAFARGQALTCLALAAFYGAGLSLIGLDFGLVIGILSGVLSFIPFFGMLIGLIPALALGFAQTGGWSLPALALAVFVVGQVLEGNVISPRLVGDRIGLHPVWMIFALLAGGALFGFLGALLAVPVAATIGVLVRFALARYLASPLYTGEKPS